MPLQRVDQHRVVTWVEDEVQPGTVVGRDDERGARPEDPRDLLQRPLGRVQPGNDPERDDRGVRSVGRREAVDVFHARRDRVREASIGEPCVRRGDHRRARVDALDAIAARGEGDGQEASAAADLEHAGAGGQV